MGKFASYVAVALAAAVPGLWLRFGGVHADPLVATPLFGAALLGAGFLLSWGAEAAEKHVSQGLIVAALALVTVLPEYAVDIYYAFEAGRAPGSDYVRFAAANMTGANRLLVGVAWPLVVVLAWWRGRKWAGTAGAGVELEPHNAVEIGFLALASAYAFLILFRNRIGLVDTLALLAIFGLYVWRLSKQPKEAEADGEEEPGPAAALATLPKARQFVIMGTLTVVAAAIILAMAEPFAEALVAAGGALGIDQFLLIQWLAPLASEAPTVTVAVLLVLAGRATSGLVAMVSDKINQWTLLVGMLPLAISAGAWAPSSLPLDARQHEEFFLTAAQSLFALSLLLPLRLGLKSAASLLGLFLLQVGVAFVFRNDEARAIMSLTALAWVYLILAGILVFYHRRRLASLAAAYVRPKQPVIQDERP
ncbi:MAG: sodium:proton exchanger [Rhodospirillales bacterium 69-11]|nr:hypothetical protein [Rhodospirillales bacterium]MBN8925298.1 hypothetical protein [Rhodospirillales bacterium]OJW21930.1 MAG: sodium:proton exchanger [Rhodospirillales bacterium 69-11]